MFICLLAHIYFPFCLSVTRRRCMINKRCHRQKSKRLVALFMNANPISIREFTPHYFHTRDGWKTLQTFFSRLPKGKKTFCVAAFIPFCLHGFDISRRARAIRLRGNVRTWLFPELLKAPFMGVAAVSVSPYKAIFGPFSSLDQREKLPFESGVVNLPRSRAEECIVSMPKVGERPLSRFWP